MEETYAGAEDYASLWQFFDEAEQHSEDLRNDGREIARWQTEYRKLVSVHTLEERAKGTPATSTDAVVKGLPDVVDAQYRWLCAEADSKADNHLAYLKEQKAAVMTAIIKNDFYRPSNQ